MSNIRPFQIVMLGVFGLLAVISMILLGAYQSQRNQEATVYGDRVVVWGTFDQLEMRNIFATISDDIESFRVVQYVQIDEDTFDEQLVNAIAEGNSPDLVILSSDRLVKHRAKLLAIPYETLPLRTFKDAYVDGAEIFTLEDGVYAVPIAVDPIVQYWNRDLFSTNGLAQAPASWEEIVNAVVPRIAIRDYQRNVLTAAIPFGEYRNVTHAKEILMMLALQSGSQMVFEKDGKYEVALDTPLQVGARAPLGATLQFFTDFSNANSSLYTWNRAMPTDKNAFLAGDLAVYYGRGSEYAELAGKNPNLNFDASVVPQGTSATIKRTHGIFYGFAIPKAASNRQGAFATAKTIANQTYGALFTQQLGLGSPLRQTIASGSGDPIHDVLLRSSLIAYGWLDPNAQASDAVFQQMVEDVVSNKARVNEATSDAVNRLIDVY